MELTVAELQGVCHLPCWGRQSHRRPFQGRTWGRRSNEGPWSFLRLPCHQFQPEGQGQRGPPRRGPRHPFLPSQPWKSQATQRSWCVRQDMGNHFQLPVTHHKVVSDCWDTTDTDSQTVGILQTLIHRLLGYYRHWFTDCWDTTDRFTDCWDATDTDWQTVGMLQTLIHRLLGCYRHRFTRLLGSYRQIHRLLGCYRHWFTDCWDATDTDSQTVGILQTDSQKPCYPKMYMKWGRKNNPKWKKHMKWSTGTKRKEDTLYSQGWQHSQNSPNTNGFLTNKTHPYSNSHAKSKRHQHTGLQKLTNFY